LRRSTFLTAGNLTNLALQIAALGTISVGVVLVLLLGEIDLSAGAVSGLTAAIMAVLNVKHGWNPYLAMAAALVVGTGIGLFQGSMATRLAVPTFVVTLAGLLAWQGAQLKVLGETGTVNIADPAITNIAGTFLADWLGWIVAIAAVATILVTSLLTRRRRAKRGLELEPIANVVLRVGAAAAAIIATVWVVNSDRGCPALADDPRRRRGRVPRDHHADHVRAPHLRRWGQRRGARRAGIKVAWVRTCVFALASMLAAAGGIMAASRLLAVNQSSRGSDLLLLAIAGPVIAGVSLFGGRGNVWAALLGALVIGSISNGMDLMALESSVKFMVTGAVLFGSVALDALARQRRRVHGRL
jgi:D-xylose transport system permease protein